MALWRLNVTAAAARKAASRKTETGESGKRLSGEIGGENGGSAAYPSRRGASAAASALSARRWRAASQRRKSRLRSNKQALNGAIGPWRGGSRYLAASALARQRINIRRHQAASGGA